MPNRQYGLHDLDFKLTRDLDHIHESLVEMFVRDKQASRMGRGKAKIPVLLPCILLFAQLLPHGDVFYVEFAYT